MAINVLDRRLRGAHHCKGADRLKAGLQTEMAIFRVAVGIWTLLRLEFRVYAEHITAEALTA